MKIFHLIVISMLVFLLCCQCKAGLIISQDIALEPGYQNYSYISVENPDRYLGTITMYVVGESTFDSFKLETTEISFDWTIANPYKDTPKQTSPFSVYATNTTKFSYITFGFAELMPEVDVITMGFRQALEVPIKIDGLYIHTVNSAIVPEPATISLLIFVTAVILLKRS